MREKRRTYNKLDNIILNNRIGTEILADQLNNIYRIEMKFGFIGI